MAFLVARYVCAVLYVVVLSPAVAVVEYDRLATDQACIPVRLFVRHSAGLHAGSGPIHIDSRIKVGAKRLEVWVARLGIVHPAVGSPVERRAEQQLEVWIVLLGFEVEARHVLGVQVRRCPSGLYVRWVHREPGIVEVERKAHADRCQEPRPPIVQLPRTRRRERQYGTHRDVARAMVQFDSELTASLAPDAIPLAVQRRRNVVAVHPDGQRAHLVEKGKLEEVLVPVVYHATPLALRPVADCAFADRKSAAVDALDDRHHAPNRAKPVARLDGDFALRHIKRISLRLVNWRTG